MWTNQTVWGIEPKKGAPKKDAAAPPSILQSHLGTIPAAVQRAIELKQVPGAVVLIGAGQHVVYRKAFGYRSLVPRRTKMTVNTIFDMASVTKVVATTTAVMQLVEAGKLRLEDPVADYWPEFGANGKDHITIRELMTHFSGLPPDLELKPEWSGYDTAMKMIVATKPTLPPGVRFVYSDINYETLGEVVHRVSGETLDAYCLHHIFKPLGMKDSGFNPSLKLRKRIAPTEYRSGSSGEVLLGVVHDPTSRFMHGVAGHAGLFSTAGDLSIFAQMLLNGGTYKGTRILSPLSVEKMTTPQTPPNQMVLRGLGWDIDSPFASNRGELFGVGSYGHTGFTGTSIWIDPVTRTYIIVLTNRVHPNGKGDAGPLRGEIADIVASALGPLSSKQVLASRASLTGFFELMKSYRMQGLRNGQVKTGIDVLEADNFAPLAGKRVGLISNHSGLDSQGNRTVDLLFKAPNVKLVALFAPEHGFYTDVGEGGNVPSTTDITTSLPVYSLYGENERPTEQELNGLDALVFDIQDVGVRFYTYTTTMAYCMEEAAKKGIEFYVLDRPNPLDGTLVQGPLLDPDLRSFVGYFPMPVRHGMTMGEMATMFKAENHIPVKMTVIKMQGYERSDWLDESGQYWINPSPNLRNLIEEVLYPGVGMVENANVSVGRGTDTPFELIGAPWVDARKLAAYLNGEQIQGVRFIPTDFKPASNAFAGEVCHGVQIVLLDRQALDSPAMGAALVQALYKLFPNDFQIDKTLSLVGSHAVVQAIKDGDDPYSIVLHWQDPLQDFRRIREKYLLY